MSRARRRPHGFPAGSGRDGSECVTQECSSAGRASVSKTEGRGFESLHSCHSYISRRSTGARPVPRPQNESSKSRMARKPGKSPQAMQDRAAKTAAVDGHARRGRAAQARRRSSTRSGAVRPARSAPRRARSPGPAAQRDLDHLGDGRRSWSCWPPSSSASSNWIMRLGDHAGPQARDRRVREMSEAAAAARRNPRHKWYIVHAYSNFEKKVAEIDPRAGQAARAWRRTSPRSWCRPRTSSRSAAAARSTPSASSSPAMCW